MIDIGERRAYPVNPVASEPGGRIHWTHQMLAASKSKVPMIRKLSSGQYRLYSRKKNPKTGRRRNLGTFATRKAAEAHERAVQYFKRR
jgi:hypothetical protein